VTELKQQDLKKLLKTVCLIAGFSTAVLLTVMILTYRCWLTAIASVLAVDEPPRCVDAIVAVSGDHHRRQLAMDLYNQGYARLLIFNVSDTVYYFGAEIDPVASVRDDASRRGIPLASIVTNKGINSTFEDALATRETVRRLRLKSLLVVTSHFNSRRARFAYRKVMNDMELDFCFCSVPPEVEKMSVDRWWSRERELVTVVNEYIKLILYYLKY
jgi:uncharacterized SAM-binding protein YcdF (DUF218 family)